MEFTPGITQVSDAINREVCDVLTDTFSGQTVVAYVRVLARCYGGLATLNEPRNFSLNLPTKGSWETEELRAETELLHCCHQGSWKAHIDKIISSPHSEFSATDLMNDNHLHLLKLSFYCGTGPDLDYNFKNWFCFSRSFMNLFRNQV